jgi:uncharacterized membrane protein HdeD (DUF308 family)
MALGEKLAGRLADILSRNWWVLLLRGIAAVIFGILMLTNPGISLATLTTLFGAYALADGVLAAWTALFDRDAQSNWMWLLIEGLLGIAVGLLVMFNAAMTTLLLIFYIGIRAVVTGLIEIFVAIRLRKEIENEWALIFAGIVSVIIGSYFLGRPGAGAVAVAWLIAIYALLFGLLFIFLAFRVKSIAGRIQARLS